MQALRENSPCGSYLVTTRSGSQYAFTLSTDGVAMTRNPAPHSLDAESWGSSLYADGQPIHCTTVRLRVGAPGIITFIKPERVGGPDGYLGTVRGTTEVLTIRRLERTSFDA